MSGFVMKQLFLSVWLATLLAVPAWVSAKTDTVPNPLTDPKTIDIKPAPPVKQPESKPTPKQESKPKTPKGGYTFRCKDGTTSQSAQRRGACSHHGGIAD